MIIRETLTYHHYEVTEQSTSKIDPSKEVTKVVGFKCPFCKTLHEPLVHLEKMKCGCGLEMQLAGNLLHCAKEFDYVENS